jgi:serine/threonine-protein kinase RsbW
MNKPKHWEVNILLLHDVADWLENNKDNIVEKVNSRIYDTIGSYRKGHLPREESVKTMVLTLSFIIDFLRDKQVSIESETSNFMGDLIKFEDGIASQRAIYEIELEDLMHGIRIFREEVWNLIASAVGDRCVNAQEFIQLEKRINLFINYMTTRIASSYNKTMEEIIGNQESALRKWEEVIKSASSIELKIPCQGEFAAIVRLQAEAIARRLDYPEEEIQDIKVAVGEACDNAIEHGVSPKGIDVHYHLSPEEMQVEIIDYGPGFDPSGKGEEPPDLFAERGRGIFLIKSLMDRTEIYSKPGEGTMIILAKKRK